jgi:hypothetical protein
VSRLVIISADVVSFYLQGPGLLTLYATSFLKGMLRNLGFAMVHFRRTTTKQRINIELWLVGFPKWVPLLALRSHLSLTYSADRCGHHHSVRSTITEPSAQFLPCCTLNTPWPYTSINWVWVSVGEICFAHKNGITLSPVQGTIIRVSSTFDFRLGVIPLPAD